MLDKYPDLLTYGRSGYFVSGGALLEGVVGRVFYLLARIERQRYEYCMRATRCGSGRRRERNVGIIFFFAAIYS